MSREVRRVPLGWEHPRQKLGGYQPLFDRSFEEAAAEYEKQVRDWLAGEGEDYAKWGAKYRFWEWFGDGPDSAFYRPTWDKATAYQVYETVSEGTPVSPVLATRKALLDWLVNDGDGLGIGGRRMPLTREQAEAFADAGYAPSMIYSNATGLVSGLQGPQP